MHDEWTDKLSEYLDGELTPEDRYAVESHLQGCPACAAVLDDLQRIVARAKTVEPRPPQADLWDGIAGRIEADRASARITPFRAHASRRIAFTLPQLAAAAVLIAAVSGGVVWSLAGRTGEIRSDMRGATAAPTEEAAEATEPAQLETVSLAEAEYDAAVADLEKALKEGRGRLDASTVAVVEHNLETIDQAIRQAREALDADPANTYLSSHLVETRRRKLDLLRRATALVSETD